MFIRSLHFFLIRMKLDSGTCDRSAPEGGTSTGVGAVGSSFIIHLRRKTFTKSETDSIDVNVIVHIDLKVSFYLISFKMELS